jgi:hypothetical protein
VVPSSPVSVLLSLMSCERLKAVTLLAVAFTPAAESLSSRFRPAEAEQQHVQACTPQQSC